MKMMIAHLLAFAVILSGCFVNDTIVAPFPAVSPSAKTAATAIAATEPSASSVAGTKTFSPPAVSPQETAL